MGKDYQIEINGEMISVSEEVYYAYKRPAWREHKRAKARAEKELSFEAFTHNGFDIASDEPLVDGIVADKLLLEQLLVALTELADDERLLIDALFNKEQTEREIAAQINISQQAVNKKKTRIISRLRSFLKL